MEEFIAILLLVIFSGLGTLGCAIVLSNAETPGPWIATFICVIITCIVICCVRLKEMWGVTAILAIIGCFGAVQSIIIYTIDHSSGGDWVAEFMFGILSQPLVCLFGYCISRLVEKYFEIKAKHLAHKIGKQLNTQISALENIEHEILTINASYKVSDDLILLLSIVADKTLESAYISSRSQRNSQLLSQIAGVSSKYNLHIDTKGKILSVIHIDVNNRIQEKTKLLSEITKEKFSKKGYDSLKAKLKKLN